MPQATNASFSSSVCAASPPCNSVTRTTSQVSGGHSKKKGKPYATAHVLRLPSDSVAVPLYITSKGGGELSRISPRSISEILPWPPLYVAYICPFAQRPWITRNYKDKMELVPIDLLNRPAWYKEKLYSENKVDIAYAPFVERFQTLLLDVKNYDILKGRPKLALWIEVLPCPC
ncbi:hypothetical protein B296_00026926 [Ensete ventricosum]|uniref:GST N-terminal domain-containing protein n=1 Tax=Ensete ventricosum TaxID=4639 RepID=A0A426ZES6_ENSVE|nr:hypothetical protein B296_00026926 [Ensete ventricosum]